MDRYGFTRTFENNYHLINKKYNLGKLNKDYNFSPEIINQGVKIKSKFGYGFFKYSNNASQSVISASVGPEFTYGNFKNKSEFSSYDSILNCDILIGCVSSMLREKLATKGKILSCKKIFGLSK